MLEYFHYHIHVDTVTTSTTGAPDLKLTNFILSRPVLNGSIYSSEGTSITF